MSFAVLKNRASHNPASTDVARPMAVPGDMSRPFVGLSRSWAAFVRASRRLLRIRHDHPPAAPPAAPSVSPPTFPDSGDLVASSGSGVTPMTLRAIQVMRSFAESNNPAHEATRDPLGWQMIRETIAAATAMTPQQIDLMSAADAQSLARRLMMGRQTGVNTSAFTAELREAERAAAAFLSQDVTEATSMIHTDVLRALGHQPQVAGAAGPAAVDDSIASCFGNEAGRYLSRSSPCRQQACDLVSAVAQNRLIGRMHPSSESSLSATYAINEANARRLRTEIDAAMPGRAAAPQQVARVLAGAPLTAGQIRTLATMQTARDDLMRSTGIPANLMGTAAAMTETEARRQQIEQMMRLHSMGLVSNEAVLNEAARQGLVDPAAVMPPIGAPVAPILDEEESEDAEEPECQQGVVAVSVPEQSEIDVGLEAQDL